MRTRILRHGQTEYSTKQLLNGDPSVSVQLSEEGARSCQRAWTELPLHCVRTWAASRFPRAKQTALLLTGSARRGARGRAPAE
ncbi:histidine phosphatase family protein [Streptomyces sp. NPDC001840]